MAIDLIDCSEPEQHPSGIHDQIKASFPPFELGKYRLLYLEISKTITELCVEGDPAFHETKILSDYMDSRWAQDRFQVTDILARIVLTTERAPKIACPPDVFLLHGQDYTVLVERIPWKAGRDYIYKQEVISLENEEDDRMDVDDEGGNEQKMEEVEAWLFKWKVTYVPEAYKD